MRINHSFSITLAELKQVWNNKRFLFLLVVVPIIICISFGFVTYRNPEGIDLTVFVDTYSGEAVSDEIQTVITDIDNYARDDGTHPFLVTVELNSRKMALQRLNQGLTRGVIILQQGADGQLEGVEVVCAVGETTVSSVIEEELGKYFQNYSREVSNQRLAEVIEGQGNISPQKAASRATNLLSGVETVMRTDAWTNLRYFDFYASAMIVLVAVGMPMLLSVISITSERSKGTIERIFVSPYRKSEIILGKVLAHSIFAMLMVVLFVGTLKLVFNVALGDLSLVMLLAILVGINGAVLGLLVSSVTYSESESVIIGIMSLLGIMAVMTYLFPWETMHPIARVLSGIIPFTYGIQTIRQVNMVGVGLAEVWPNLVILSVSIVGLVMISIPVLRREIK
jgi:ABC-type Na+ efflux pump permease subunit